MATKRLMNVAGHFPSRIPSTMSNDKDGTVDWTIAKIPAYDALPAYKNMPGCAWSVWGPQDELGTVNLLTEDVVKTAAGEEIRIGKCISLNWPLNFPEKPMFARRTPEILMTHPAPGALVRDDEIHINTQSGTQWDGLRHFPLLEHGVFYNKLSGPCAIDNNSLNTVCHSLPSGVVPIPNPHEIDPAHARIGIQNWATHGICGRGVLLDLVSYFTLRSATKTLSYDPWTTHGITVPELEACAVAQGVSFRRGDILILRVGFIKKYYEASQGERDALQAHAETFAGIEQSEAMKRFLWNNHFSAIASDQPALERWPTPEGTPHMHQVGEFFDVEKLSEVCAETKRYTFFFSSWPLNIIGGCASPPNAAITSQRDPGRLQGLYEFYFLAEFALEILARR
ncbi:hypothetical protein B0H10DRAFT_1984324 [Mycena sp. CBHHK59/15]|nr:hypothetical protein B0H10DRAFT_1984324 [Mycena sp. CBHHK59/15]